MVEKRKDNKGRVLRNGESQRKDGKYEFKYTTQRGERKSVYSWKLVDTDKLPAGKHACESLRSIEKKILKDLEDGIDSYSATKLTLNNAFDNFIETKVGIKGSTKSNYIYVYNQYVRDDIGHKAVGEIKYSTVKKFYVSLNKERGLMFSSIASVDKILGQVFKALVKDEIVRTNPVTGILGEVKAAKGSSTENRVILTEEQQASFVNHVAQTPKWHKWLPLITILLGTGMRIGELIALTWEDCDFDEGLISVTKTLSQETINGKRTLVVNTPKTAAGKREIPMLQDVKKALLKQKLMNKATGKQPASKEFGNLVFLTRGGKPLDRSTIFCAFDSIIISHNTQEEKNAIALSREPILLPHFSPHNLRHTFCTRFCERESNLKVIQEIMGHSNISVTMNVYNHATRKAKLESFKSLEGSMKIS